MGQCAEGYLETQPGIEIGDTITFGGSLEFEYKKVLTIGGSIEKSKTTNYTWDGTQGLIQICQGLSEQAILSLCTEVLDECKNRKRCEVSRSLMTSRPKRSVNP